MRPHIRKRKQRTYLYTSKDKRGRFTKKTKQEKIKALRNYYTIKQTFHCDDCHVESDNWTTTCEGDSYVCIACGTVSQDAILFESAVYCDQFPQDYNRKNGYKHRNYFAERIRQFSNTEPRFSKQEQIQIENIHSVLWLENSKLWDPTTMQKPDFAKLFRIMHLAVPHMKWNRRLERWLQAKHILLHYNDIHFDNTIPEKLLVDLRLLFDGIAFTFSNDKKDDRHNIFRLDYICLLLLYTLDPTLVTKHGWYFCDSRLLFKHENSVLIWKNVINLFIDTNIKMRSNRFDKTSIYPETIDWFYKNTLNTCSLDAMINLLMENDQVHEIFYRQFLINIAKISKP